MKRLSIIVILLCSALIAGAQPDTLRVLAVGNSFSRDAVEQNLHELGAADGVVIIVGNMYIPGCSLERHYSNAVDNVPDYEYCKISADGRRTVRPCTELAYALADEPWDFVTFQQVSHDSGRYETFVPYLPYLLDYARKIVPEKTKFCWHQTWAYDSDIVRDTFVIYDRDQTKMYNDIAEASRKVCDRYGLKLIPAGTAIQNLRKTVFGRNSITRDGYHMNNTLGRYAVACTWYEALTGRSVEGNVYAVPFMYDAQIPAAQMCAHLAVARPFEVTNPGMDNPPANYDVDKIPSYTLPDPLTFANGKKVRNARQWMKRRRPELLSAFETEMYGRAPGRPEKLHFRLLRENKDAFGGLAVAKEVGIYFSDDESQYIRLLVLTPRDADGPVPAFLGVNFQGNHAITTDEWVSMIGPDEYSRYGRYTEYPRGNNARRWPIELILSRGYGVATFYRGDIDPDWDDSFTNGVHKLFYKKGQSYPEPDEWGTIAAWAWGLSRALDYLENDPDVDGSKVAVIGHSRLGKAALWAGATDQRFAMVVSNCSGCGGAAISRRAFGETVRTINNQFPHWFCGNFYKYSDNEAALPFDQHELLALIAPRPLCVASATEDLWADPEGQKIAAEEADKVYRFLGYEGMVQYHTREGGHDIVAYDWNYYLDFADQKLSHFSVTE